MIWFARGALAATVASGWAIAAWLVLSGQGYAGILWLLLAGGTAAAFGSWLALARDRRAIAGVAALGAVATPTFYFYLPNLALLVAVPALLLSAARR
jgi:hypothetical protein